MSLLKIGRPSINKTKEFHELETESLETLTIMIPITLKKKLKLKAVHRDSTVTKIILNYIREYVEDDNT
jgi:hypothetical protein